jgi:hypothetical protein
MDFGDYLAYRLGVCALAAHVLCYGAALITSAALLLARLFDASAGQ